MSGHGDGWEAEVSVPLAAGMDAGARALLLDEETGLPGYRWIHPFLVGRAAVAQHTCRPVSLALASVGEHPDRPVTGPSAAVAGATLVTALRDSDTVGRLDDGRFVVVMEDTSISQALIALERVSRHLSAVVPAWRLWAGVGTCPSHSLEPSGLWRVTLQAQGAARGESQACLVVADAE